jgi:hypothetical protein
MKKRMLAAIAASMSLWMIFACSQKKTESNAEQKAKPVSEKTVQLDLNDTSCAVEVIVSDKDGKPSVTIYSTAISGGISQSQSDVTPIVVCAVLDDGEIIDPMFVAGGKQGGAGYSIREPKVLSKLSSTDSDGGRWESAGSSSKGYLTYSFPVSQPVRKIIIGTYANYAESNYDAFVSVDLQDDLSNE